MKKNLNKANRFCHSLRPSLNRGYAASQLKGKEIKERHTHNFYSGLRTASQSSSVVLELSETVKNENAIKFHCIYWKWTFRVKNVCWSTDIICTYNHFVLIHRIRKLLCKKVTTDRDYIKMMGNQQPPAMYASHAITTCLLIHWDLEAHIINICIH